MLGRRQGRAAKAFVDGEICPLGRAIDSASSLLRRSRQAVFAGLGCDIEGVRAVVRLAERIGGAIDHLSGTPYGREISVIRDAGLFVTTPGEAKVRADLVLLVGSSAFNAARRLADPIFGKAPRLAACDRPRRILWLGGKRLPPAHLLTAGLETTIVPNGQLGPALAALGACLARRQVSCPLPARRLSALAEALRQARFGVAVWSSEDLDELALETLVSLVRDLNRTTRFSCLPLPPEDNAAGVAMALTWLTGFPSNIGFGRGNVEYDPWRFDAARLALSGEADLLLWISAYRDSRPAFPSQVPLIVLSRAAGAPRKWSARIEIEVGRPGVDHDGIDLSAATGQLAYRGTASPGGAPSVAEVLGMIGKALDRASGARR